MNRQFLPLAVFTGLLAAAIAAPAAAAGPAPAMPASRPQPVDDATLAQVCGKFLGQQMLVGLRIDLVSTISAPQGAASASGSLLMQTDGQGGMRVQVDTHSDAHATPTAPASGQAVVQGGQGMQVEGIAQTVQIAGDGNRMVNIARIGFGPLDTSGTFNGRSESTAADGALMARIRFDEGVQVAVSMPGVRLQQRLGDQHASLLQSGQIAADQVSASNQLQLRLMTRELPVVQQHRLGIEQALSGLAPIGR